LLSFFLGQFYQSRSLPGMLTFLTEEILLYLFLCGRFLIVEGIKKASNKFNQAFRRFHRQGLWWSVTMGHLLAQSIPWHCQATQNATSSQNYPTSRDKDAVVATGRKSDHMSIYVTPRRLSRSPSLTMMCQVNISSKHPLPSDTNAISSYCSREFGFV
jgi:hypothetical protein